MKIRNFINIFVLLIIIKLSHGLFDGMVSCAYGTYEKSELEAKGIKRMVKRSIKEGEIRFFLYNKNYPEYGTQIFLHDENSLVKGNFDTKKLTKIFIHGYKSSIKTSSCRLIREAFLQAGDFNIIIVDWSIAQRWGINHAFLRYYPNIVERLFEISDYVRLMIQFLENHGMNLNTTTVVGHSLGAHIAGIACHNLNNKVYRIIGLDPAAPYMSNRVPGERLSKEDATHVEVIHTEIDHCGMNVQLGHYDFYPNSGELQPGCEKYKCSHSRSYRYFAESIVTKIGFYARLCEDWQSMKNGNCNGEQGIMGGLDRAPIQEGIYYLKTNDEAPFARGPF